MIWIRVWYMHTHETICSHFTTTLVLQRAQDWYAFDTLLLYSIYMCCIWSYVVVLTIYCLWLCRALIIYGQAYFDTLSERWQVTALANLTNKKYMFQLLPPLIESQGAWVECILHWLLWIIPIITQSIKNYDHLCLILYIVLLPPLKKVGTLVNSNIHRHSYTL